MDRTERRALIALKTAIDGANCTIEICDYNGDGDITATDALAILKMALGQPIAPNCRNTEAP